MSFLYSVMILTIFAFSQEEFPSCKIISFMPDFYDFWEEAEGKPLEEKIALWNNLFESKHSEFYRQTVYNGLKGERLNQFKSRKLRNFLESLKKEGVDRMKSEEESLRRLIPQAVSDLNKLIPAGKEVSIHYIIPSVNTSSGSARPYNRSMIVFYGLEYTSRIKSQEFRKAIIAHEVFHTLHFKNIIPAFMKKYGKDANFSTVLQKGGPLLFAFCEGLAVFSTEKLYPGIPRPGLIEKYVPQYEENFIAYTKELLKDMTNFNYQKYRKYFLDPNDDPSFPDKFGYWLGYKIVEALSKDFSIKEMMGWSPEKINQMMRREVNRMCKIPS